MQTTKNIPNNNPGIDLSSQERVATFDMQMQNMSKVKDVCVCLGRQYATISSGRHFRDKGSPLSLEHVCPFNCI